MTNTRQVLYNPDGPGQRVSVLTGGSNSIPWTGNSPAALVQAIGDDLWYMLGGGAPTPGTAHLLKQNELQVWSAASVRVASFRAANVNAGLQVQPLA
jgi:hypothetical protein